MSRICVKNLPKHVVEDRLREFFSQKGEVTDAKLMRTQDGKSRQFAFIGFRTEHEAQEALKYFNNSYMDTYRLNCEVARKIGDSNAPRPWSRHSAVKQEGLSSKKKESIDGKGLNTLERKGESKKSKKSTADSDSQLHEFLQVMQPRTKTKLWGNDTVGNDQNSKTNVKETKSKKGGKIQSAPELDEMSEKESDCIGTHLVKKPHDTAIADVVSDTEYFKSRVKKDWSDSDSGTDEDVPDESPDGEDNQDVVDEDYRNDQISNTATTKTDVEEDFENSDYEMNEPGDISQSTKEEEHILETGRLFVRNLPYTATEDDLTELFQNFGDLSEVHLVIDKGTKRSKGFAYILYSLPESAARALGELDGSIFQGRLLHVMPAKPQNSSKAEEDIVASQTSKPLKQQREERRKESEASGDTRAWNSLYMRSDTVVENIARKYGVSKSDILDPEADDHAVRLALGEAQVISDTKKALLNSGVNVSALEEFVSGKSDTVKRSNYVILVKNLPYGSSEDDLVKMFGKFGSIEKVILPPTKTLALVIFLEKTEARAAFKGLAYKRYKDAPLYLEWAPSNILSSNPKVKNVTQIDIIGTQDVKKVLLEGTFDEDIDPDRIESRSLFVKNLNFKTSDECLRKHFSENMKKGSIRSVKITKHLRNGKNVSKGFGFIEFDSVETASNTCTNLQGTILDGHALILQICHAKTDENAPKKAEKDKSSTKLIVRNVPFQATEKDLRQLFSAFGQIKSLRLPMKFGKHRGFAFVEFITKQETQNALQALASTHLYGRHLVLERAKEGETLEELRLRTAEHFTDEQSGFQVKKRKHNFDEFHV